MFMCLQLNFKKIQVVCVTLEFHLDGLESALLKGNPLCFVWFSNVCRIKFILITCFLHKQRSQAMIKSPTSNCYQ